MNWLRPHHSPIGVDITSDRLRLLQLHRCGGVWAVRDKIELPRLRPGQPFDRDEAHRLAGVLRRRSFIGSEVIVALPNCDLIRGLIEVKASSGSDPLLDAALDIERTHGLEPGTYELAAWLPPASGARRQAAVCVNGTPHDVAEVILSAFDAAGLYITAIDSRACALSRVIDTEDRHGVHLTAVLDIEHDGAELALLHRGGVVYQRPLIDAGLEHAVQRMADGGLDEKTSEYALRNIGLSDFQDPRNARIHEALRSYAQGLIQEAQPALDYAARVYSELPIERFALVGEGAGVPLLGFELRQQLKLDSTSAQPSRVTGLEDDRAYGVALGLTLHPQEASWVAA